MSRVSDLIKYQKNHLISPPPKKMRVVCRFCLIRDGKKRQDPQPNKWPKSARFRQSENREEDPFRQSHFHFSDFLREANVLVCTVLERLPAAHHTEFSGDWSSRQGRKKWDGVINSEPDELTEDAGDGAGMRGYSFSLNEHRREIYTIL